MTDKYLVEPDVGFIKEVVGLGGGDLKKCFQCATCSVVCPISPDNKPFPRKEMIAASWGLKDRLVGNGDIWLCHNCGDCSTMCPRGAKPGDVLGAIRSYAIADYATPKFLGKAVSDPKKLPILLLIPAVIFMIAAYITTNFSEALTNTFGELWSHGVQADMIAPANFISTWFVDMVFVPLALWVVVILGLGIKRFLADIHADAVLHGKTDKEKIDPQGFILALVRVIPIILKHSKFNECSENKERSTAHLLVFYGFVGLFVVTNIFFIALYLMHSPGPYSQINPVKWLANIAGVALIAGGFLMIKNRLSKEDQVNSYVDWYLIGLVLGLGLTGMLTEITRLAGLGSVSYFIYYLHLICVFMLFAFLPFSKLAHIVYRTVAMAYAEYSGRGFIVDPKKETER